MQLLIESLHPSSCFIPFLRKGAPYRKFFKTNNIALEWITKVSLLLLLLHIQVLAQSMTVHPQYLLPMEVFTEVSSNNNKMAKFIVK
jgi:hypothetical protein